MPKSLIAAGAITIALLAISCARSPRMAEPPKSVARFEQVSDANIAAIVVAANNADIAYANMALNKATTDEVKAYARNMIAAHGGVNTSAAALVAKLGVTPVENSISLDLRDNSDAVRDRLREKEGIAFDRDYIDNEITYHEALLRTIDETLSPSAQNAELRDLVRGTRDAVVAHLAEARRIRGSLR